MNLSTTLSFLSIIIYSSNEPMVYCWFFSGSKGNSSPEEKTVVSGPEGKVPFEMTTADEKFLAEARFTKELSPLDLCHHMVTLSAGKKITRVLDLAVHKTL